MCSFSSFYSVTFTTFLTTEYCAISLRRLSLLYTEYIPWISVFRGYAPLLQYMSTVVIAVLQKCAHVLLDMEERMEKYNHRHRRCSLNVMKRRQGLRCCTLCLKKTVQTYFLSEFVKFWPILEIFGTKIAASTRLSEVYSFATSPNLCQRTTVLNTDFPNCYMTL